MVGTPSAVNILFNDFGGMPNFYSMAAALMKSCVTIWGESIAKISNP
jgi:hypothetical protein